MNSDDETRQSFSTTSAPVTESTSTDLDDDRKARGFRMTSVRATIVAALIAAAAAIIAAIIAMHGSSGLSNACPADNGSIAKCTING
jgi:hypothetical protein